MVVDLFGDNGSGSDEQGVTGVFSVSKGIGALVIALLIQRGLLDLDKPVAHYWEDFGYGGKTAITVRQLLSHQAGLLGTGTTFEQHEILESSKAAAKLARTVPQWHPGSMFGYHAITIGVFMEEIVRRVTGRELREIYEEEIRAPRQVDFYLGFPEAQEHRYRELSPMRPTIAQQAESYRGRVSSDTLGDLASNTLGNSHSLLAGQFSPNLREVRAAGPAAIGGVGSARGLAKVYAAAIGDVAGPRFLDEATVLKVTQQQAWGHDRVLDVDMCFGVVFAKSQPRADYGSYLAFGHDGAGGAIGFADPFHEIGFGYIPMPMQYPGGVDPKALVLTRTVRECIKRQLEA
ncbi:MAG: beta-lactamase family protein [Rhizobiaceae bacterium]|nr:beta-lactamase family protein [Rhizobiaceae bacterium]